MTSETELVVTVSPSGTVAGTMERSAAHEQPGYLHLAVSVQLIDRRGKWLVQRRASEKSLFAGRWSNSCCTHQRPSETAEATARRRIREELGVQVSLLRPAGSFIYRAVDPVSRRVEHELDHVFLGWLVDDPTPTPGEVAEVSLVSRDEAVKLMRSDAGAPWAGRALDLATAAFT